MRTKPSTLLKKKCKTQKEQLEILCSLADYYLSQAEVLWAIECHRLENTPKTKNNALKGKRKGIKKE